MTFPLPNKEELLNVMDAWKEELLNVMDAWYVSELLQPPRLATEKRTCIKILPESHAPWKDRKYERQEGEKAVWWFLYLGALDLKTATRKLLQKPQKEKKEGSWPDPYFVGSNRPFPLLRMFCILCLIKQVVANVDSARHERER